MDKSVTDKIHTLEELLPVLDECRKEGKVIIQSHGIFDVLHPGILGHLSMAREQGDVLVVTVVKDKDVKKGNEAPYFNEMNRALNAAAVGFVDYVCLVDDKVPFESVKIVRPDVFAKGKSSQHKDEDALKKSLVEIHDTDLEGIRFHVTKDLLRFSIQVAEKLLASLSEDARSFLEAFSRKYDSAYVADSLNSLQDMKVLVLGDGIVDEYHYCEQMGKSSKAHLVVSRYLNHEEFAGGAFAIANHVSGLCSRVDLMTLLGNDDSREAFVRSHLNSNVVLKSFLRKDAPTIVKKRYIDQYLNQKLFEVNYINDRFLDGSLEDEIVKSLERCVGDYDLVLISDFGHGFITQKIFDVVRENSRLLAVNTQTNAANTGFNLITKYSRPGFVCLDEPEVRLAAQDKYGCIEEVALQICNTLKADSLIVTLGKKGSIAVNKGREVFRTPIFSTRVVDTVGAGDAVFSFTAPLIARGYPLDYVGFMGNAVGALAVQIVGNKQPVDKDNLMGFIRSLI